MKDYVERKALRDALYEADAITMEGVKIINQFPAADVRPVPEGGIGNMSKFKAIIICGFPGVGKTTAEQRCRQAIDCESSGFQYRFDPTEVNARSPAGVYKEKQNWVQEYVDFIGKCAKDGKYRYIFASSHLKVREELDMRMMPYIVVVPEAGIKDEYLQRYVKRGDHAEFIITVSDSWDEWLNEIEQNAPAVIHLKAGQVLSDILPIPQLRG